MMFGCALKGNGSVDCWGDNTYGQGDLAGTYDKILTGFSRSCGIKDGSVECLGSLEYGIDVYPTEDVITLEMDAYSHGCAVLTSGDVHCWGCYGDDDSGLCWDPYNTYVDVKVGDIENCALRDDGVIDCWGQDGVLVEHEGEFRAFDTGSHTCALTTDDTVECWGQDDHGQATPPDTL
jgi:hypothetical protein